MVGLSQHDRDTIAEHPLHDSLSNIRYLLQHVASFYTLDSAFSNDPTLRPSVDTRQPILQLVNALQAHQAAWNLRSKTGDTLVAHELFNLYGHIQHGGYYNYDDYRTLTKLIIIRASDTDIWNAVFNLITDVSPTTLPTSIPPSRVGTPVTTSSSSFQGSEQTRERVELAIFHEIRNCTYRGVDGFFEKYFEGRSWSSTSDEIVKTMKAAGENWFDFPSTTDQDAVWEWWDGFQRKYLSDSPGIFHNTKDKSGLKGGEAERQLDILLKKRDSEAGEKHDWKDVCVIGELKKSPSPNLKPLLKQLAVYMRDVFTAQPIRRFIHGFFLHGTIMELWVFDRSGPYSSGEFNIHEHPEKFIRAITGYAMMNDEELGMDTFTQLNDCCRLITISSDARGELKVQMEQAPFVKRDAVVCRGTSCFRNSDQASVVKFSWTSDKPLPERAFLELANERGVEGIARLIGYQRITSIRELRSGLTFKAPHSFRETASTGTPLNRTQSHSIPKTSSKRMRAGGEGWQKKSKLSQHCDILQESGEPAVRLPEVHDGSYSDRIFGCLAIAPAGRALGEFANEPQSETQLQPIPAIKTLLAALRDAIKGHCSLYLKGNILHRDISENNIIITDRKETGGYAGMLIDLDHAKDRDMARSSARHQTGTIEFMAIEVLRGVDHTYRHDLESFFYVLLWIIARRVWEKGIHCNTIDRPKKDLLEKWYTGDFSDISDAKHGQMASLWIFEKVLQQFPGAYDPVKPLCREIHRNLFPASVTAGERDIGTSDQPERLYMTILNAFDSAITQLPPH
ncbi:MAG: hypothetical protein Q9219_005073 [cf. Caloplaca sp. 3 TL-2023]